MVGGAAFVAAIGTGLVSDWSEVTHLSKLGLTVTPDPVASAAYEEGYRRYRSLYRHLAPYFRDVAGD